MSRHLRLFRMATPPLSEPAAYVTSWPYPYYHVEEMQTSVGFIRGDVFRKIQDELDIGIAFSGAELRDIFREYTDWPAESLDTGVEFVSGSMDSIFLSYDEYAPEELETGIDFVSGATDQIRIVYDRPTDELETSIGFVAGEME